VGHTNANDLCPGRRFPTCSEEAEGSMPEYIVAGLERWVWIEGFVTAAMKPLFSNSDITGDTVWLSLRSVARSRGMRGLMISRYRVQNNRLS
jgi:hypothetical protein